MHILNLAVLLFSVLVPTFTYARDSQHALTPDRPDHESSKPLSRPFRIAIIGAGAAGASAAYHISRFINESSLSTELIDVTVFDSNPRPGGRSTTVHALDSPSHPVELGASIFVKINYVLCNATKEFALVTNIAFHDRPRVENGYGLGIWNGYEFVFRQASSGDEVGGKKPWVDWKGWWDIAKLLWRYGLAPIRTQSAVKDVVGRFLKFYDEPIFPFPSLTDAAEAARLLEFTDSAGTQTLTGAKVSDDFQRDIIQSSTRVNYAQNLMQIHGLEALCSMATEGAMSVEGGNWQIFDRMVAASNARIRLDTTVTSIQKAAKGTGTYTVSFSQTLKSQSSPPRVEKSHSKFDTVILSAPYQSTNITFDPPLAHIPKPVPYVQLHVTLFTSPHRLSPSYFGQPSQSDVPSLILTTLPPDHNVSSSARGPAAVGPSRFWSVSTLRAIRHPGTRTQYLYKIFSPSPMTGTHLSALLGFEYANTSTSDDISLLPKDDVTWSHEKVWHSYPYEVPRRQFEEIRLDGQADGGPAGVWYTSGIESFISTMETSALMGRNVARLLVDELIGSAEQ